MSSYDEGVRPGGAPPPPKPQPNPGPPKAEYPPLPPDVVNRLGQLFGPTARSVKRDRASAAATASADPQTPGHVLGVA